MAMKWRGRRMHPLLTIGLVALLLTAIGFSVRLFVNEVRAGAHFRAGQAALDAGDFPAARQHLDYCLMAWPGSAEAHFLAARAARRNGDLADALRLLDAAQKRDWVPEALELERALIRVPLGELPEVETFLTACVAQDHPEAALILEVLAPAYSRNFQLGAARHYAELWAERCPASGTAWACLGEVAQRQQDRKGAIAAYRKAVEAAPDSFPNRLRLVHLLLEVVESTEALEHIDYLRKDHPDDPVVRREWARCLFLHGQSDQARQLLDGVLAQRPDDVEALAARGRMELRENRPASAEPWLRRAAEKTPFDRAVVYPYVRCLRVAGKAGEAQRWEERLLRSERDLGKLEKITLAAAAAPHDPGPRREAGAIFMRNGQEEEGLRWLISALRQDPNHAATHLALAEYFERKGQGRQAADHRARAERKQPSPNPNLLPP